MKIKLPFVLRSTYEKETSELVKDIKVLEAAKYASDNKVLDLKQKLNLSEVREKEKSKEIERLKLELERRNKQIKGMEWCIQERDKQIKDIRAFNMKLYKKVELATEMQRQVKEKIDIAFKIDVINKERTETGARRTITSNDIKKLLKGEDLVEIYTKLGMMI
ncbi:Uncharacterised protein [[Clostridium] sordellii]|uniref:hypothetical protein n=1 Tax=Paraclostridium sordellii TaxID=1505 RepID=UPI0005DB984F|nr:hypothetical protein [Paeniclostridium sordellii]CEN84202.1 Uncharacterised protein [[Clostridium] sordellii] [Paeniclostridium sordellii]CEO09579.1 Uncharacterised protein [[Clostridium] sordellii] [Paeniclostridium sordellii]